MKTRWNEAVWFDQRVRYTFPLGMPVTTPPYGAPVIVTPGSANVTVRVGRCFRRMSPDYMSGLRTRTTSGSLSNPKQLYTAPAEIK